MCGRRATQSIDLADEYGRNLGQKHLCDDYPYCTGPLAEEQTDRLCLTQQNTKETK
jgi:hypothetical protein